MSNVAQMRRTDILSRSLVHFQCGCGRTYDNEEEKYVYYDGKSVIVTDEEDLASGTCDLPDEVRRISIVVPADKTMVLTISIFHIERLNFSINSS